MRFDQIVGGTALALVLGLGFAAQPASAQGTSNAAIEAKVPLPEPANVPPPTAADVAPETTGTTPAAAVTLPDPPDLPPPAVKDAATPAPAAAPAPAETATAPAPAATAPSVAEPAKPAEPVKAAAADQPIRDALREFIGGPKLARMVDRKADRTAVEAFYASRDYAPVFAGNDGPTALAKQAINHLRNADADGMDPTDYPVPTFQSGATPAALAEAEMRLIGSVLDYARQAQLGRVHYSRVSADIYYEQAAPQPLEILQKVASAKNAEEALDSYQPPHAAYKALRKKLAELHGKSDAPAEQIARGPVLELATDRHTKQAVLMSDERVPALRAKLGLDAVKDDTFYDKPLADAVAAFQKERGLPATGKLTQQTVDAMNGKRQERVDQTIIANMERWRWVPRDLGKAHVVLNIPDYTLRVYHNGAQVWTTRVVVGKPGVHATPLLSETMKYITVNPTWNVPPSIVYNEYLPALQQDPTVLKRMGLNLVQNRDGSVHISQPPGEANALGRIRFNFPNKFLVYQHDTPDKYLFAHPKRAYSHGCMRVQDPAKYAEVMSGLGMPGHGYTQEQIKGMYGHSEIDLRFTNPVPVHITYQTAFVDENGNLQTREDIYGRDASLLAVLKGDHKQAEIPVAHAQPGYGHPSVKLPPGVGNSDYSSGPSFFDRLFGNPVRPEPPTQMRQQRRAGAQQRVTTSYSPPLTSRRD
ncbi:MAG: L,D-transpeptidase family protein [Alphaproteobacteria bacterium]|nr:L,D-transpeptidase family protein [Alphaproteobacteria bacterium]